MPDLNRVLERILGSRKYSDIHPAVIDRQAALLADRYPSDKALEQAVRRKLHQAFGAYLEGNWLRKLKAGIVDIEGADSDTVRKVCFRLMDLHTSTRERRPIIGEFGDLLARVIPEGARVLDLACGLNALALPAITEAHAFKYIGLDLHKEMMSVLSQFAEAVGLDAAFTWSDILSDSYPECDVALMLKLLPILEHQDSGSAAQLVRDVETETVIASFPTRSMGGRNVGMEHTYQTQIEQIASETGREIERYDSSMELFYVLK